MISNVSVCNILLNYASRNDLTCFGKSVKNGPQNTSNIDLEGGLEAAREPPLCGGDPKTSFLAILAPLWDPIWGPVLGHVGHRFLFFFICLLDGIFADLGSIWVLFFGSFGGRFWKLV